MAGPQQGQGSAGVTDVVTQLQGVARHLSTSNQQTLDLISAVRGSTAAIYNSRAAVAAASPAFANLLVIGENEQASYAYDPGTTSAAIITAANGRIYRNTGLVLTPAMFGAVGDGAADDTAALKALAAEIQWRGGRTRVEFPENKTFNIDLAVLGGTYLFVLQSVQGLTMKFNGSTIRNTNAFAASGLSAIIVGMANCQDIELHDLNVTQPNYTTLTDTRGNVGIALQDNCMGIQVHNHVQTNGLLGLVCGRTSPLYRARDIFYSGDLDNVYYGTNFQKNGDQVEARYKARNSGRSYFPYNVRQHKITLDSHASGPFDDCLLKVYADGAESNTLNTLSDIDLHYSNTGRADAGASPGSAIVALGIQLSNDALPAAGYIQNIKIVAEINRDDGTFPQAPMFTAYKFNAAGVQEVTVRGHRVENLQYSGYVNGYNDGIPAIEFFVVGNMAGETVRAIRFRDLTLNGSSTSATIDGGGMGSGDLIFENCKWSVAPTLTNMPARAVDASRNNVMDTYKSFDESGTPGNDAYVNYRRLPDGGLECSGITVVGGAGSATVAFPVAFAAIPVGLLSLATVATAPPYVTAATTTQMTLNNPDAGPVAVLWTAKGYF